MLKCLKSKGDDFIAVQLLPFLITFGMGIGSSVGNVVAEALIDNTTDFVLEKANDAFEKLIPEISDNQYFNQFTNQIRSGIAASTQAKIMNKSIQTQNKIEEKIEDMKTKVDAKFKEEKDELNKIKIRKGTKGKRLTSLKQQYNHEIAQIEQDGSRIYKMKDTANKEAHSYSNGLGSLKGSNDGTLQNLKPNPTAQLTKSITDLLNAQGYYQDRSGVTAL